MTWLKLDDNFADHPKVVVLSDAAFRLHVEGMCFCARMLTDGKVIRRMAQGYGDDVIAELTSGGLWHEDGHGCPKCVQPGAGAFMVHDFLEWNPPASMVKQRRDHKKRSRDLHSDPALVAAIRKRDGSSCRYCAVKVNWSDRRGPMGATYDHVDPNGGNTFENVVVACRGCNASKGARTPEQAGMVLIQIGSRSRSSSDLAPVPSRPDPKESGSGRASGEPTAPAPSPAPSGGDGSVVDGEGDSEPAERLLDPETVHRNVEGTKALRGLLRGA